MKIVVLSNYFNHYQETLAKAFMEIPDVDFWFIAMKDVPEDRIRLGFDKSANERKYVLSAQGNEREVLEVVNAGDIVIAGWYGKKFLADRIRSDQRLFIYSERIFKVYTDRKVTELIKKWCRWIKYRYMTARYTNGQTYYLCLGSYAAEDYRSVGVKPHKILKFAYFPRLSTFPHKENRFRDVKDPKTEKIKCIWAGRFVRWKRPEDAVYAVARLAREGYPVALDMLGNGETESELKEMVSEEHMESTVRFFGGQPTDNVRRMMWDADIFLFTSTEGEGWGVTLNEAMSEGMAVLAGDGAGATTCLVEDKVNGEIYHSGDAEELYLKLKNLLDHPSLIHRYGSAARSTMESVWNAETAVRNLLDLYACLQNGNGDYDVMNGPCARWAGTPEGNGK